MPEDTVGGTRSTPGVTQGQCVNPLPCRYKDMVPHSVLTGNSLRTAASHFDVDTCVSCSVVAALRHSIAPVCTWRGADIDHVCIEGCKLAGRVRRGRVGFSHQQVDLYDRKWSVNMGEPVYRNFTAFDDGTELREELQQHVLRDGMCVLNLHRAVNLIIQHGDYLVVVDCGERNASGLASDIGRSAVVFNTCWMDLMIHILNLKVSLGAEWFGVSVLLREKAVVFLWWWMNRLQLSPMVALPLKEVSIKATSGLNMVGFSVWLLV